MENLGFIRYNFEALADNRVLEDDDDAIAELAAFSASSGSTVVDLTCIGLGQSDRLIERLAQISRRSNTQIVVGCGFYVGMSLPRWVRDLDQTQMADLLIEQLEDGFGDTGVRPGIIGEIGTSSPILEIETDTLSAAGIAARETGAAVTVHLDPFGQEGIKVAHQLLAQGVDPGRIILSHMDAYHALDLAYHRALLDIGVVLSFDNFGLESYTLRSSRLVRNNSDLERIESLARLLDLGWEDQLVIGSDVHTKTQLTRYGGTGYDHLLKRIVPALQRDFELDQESLRAVTSDNPRRLLQWSR